MADKEKKVTPKSDVDKATTDESKAAEKVAKAAKGNTNKKNKPNFFVRSGKVMKKFYKDFKGECKKIVWPDAKTVLKSTGVVILVVAIVALVVYGIDQGLSAGVQGLKGLAEPETTTSVAETTTSVAAEGESTTAEGESTTGETEESTTAASETSQAEESSTETTVADTTEE